MSLLEPSQPPDDSPWTPLEWPDAELDQNPADDPVYRKPAVVELLPRLGSRDEAILTLSDLSRLIQRHPGSSRLIIHLPDDRGSWLPGEMEAGVCWDARFREALATEVEGAVSVRLK
jgi:hypothetical protein